MTPETGSHCKDYVLKPYGGENALARHYVDYLVKRLTEFRKAGVRFGQAHHAHANFGQTMKLAQSQLKCDVHDESRFEEVCAHLREKIDATILGKRNQAKGIRNYHPFEEHGLGQSPKPKKISGTAEAGEDCTVEPGRRDVTECLDSNGSIAPEDLSTGSGIQRPDNDQPGKPTCAGVDELDQATGVLTNAATFKEWQLEEANRRLRTLQAFWKLLESGMSRTKAAKKIGIPYTTIYRWEKLVSGHSPDATSEEMLQALIPKTDECGRKPEYLPNADELACVKAIYIKLNESQVRATRGGRGRGSSKVTAYRLAAKSDSEGVSDLFRSVVLKRKSKTVPPSWLRLLDVPAAVLDYGRDRSSLSRSHNTTPRGMNFISARGEELPLRAGSIFESDDGTLNFPIWIPWPYGGDKCSDKFGVKVGRFQLLPIVDRRTRFCPMFHCVIRSKSSYRGEDATAMFGDCFFDIGLPEMLCLERASWESLIVETALKAAGVPVVRAWEPKQKNAVENFFDRLWTPLSLAPGDVGRFRGENVENTKLLLQCEDGRRDPREHFLNAEQAVVAMGNAVAFVNSEPVESRTGFGRWIPQELFMDQTGDALNKLPNSMRIFFAREQRKWLVKAGCVGGMVETPQLKVPVYFQCQDLWELEGCYVKCFFDPFEEHVTATIVLLDEWRGYRKGHIVAREVPALERPPQAVLASDWQRSDELTRGLAIRKAMAKAVRTEYWNFRGGRRSEARDGMGNTAVKNGNLTQRRQDAVTDRAAGPTLQNVTQRTIETIRSGGQPRISLSAPSADEFARKAERLRQQAENTRSLTPNF